tara:strand:+ start:423 stop:638 length:216 start_codon:yes stop_codon:yes gene_type:complete
MAQQPGAVVDEEFAETPAPPEGLVILRKIDRFGTLWCDGGLGDQPHYLMQELIICANARPDIKQSGGGDQG